MPGAWRAAKGGCRGAVKPLPQARACHTSAHGVPRTLAPHQTLNAPVRARARRTTRHARRQDIVERFQLLLVLCFVVVEDISNSGTWLPAGTTLLECGRIFGWEVRARDCAARAVREALHARLHARSPPRARSHPTREHGRWMHAPAPCTCIMHHAPHAMPSCNTARFFSRADCHRHQQARGAGKVQRHPARHLSRIHARPLQRQPRQAQPQRAQAGARALAPQPRMRSRGCVLAAGLALRRVWCCPGGCFTALRCCPPPPPPGVCATVCHRRWAFARSALPRCACAWCARC